MALSLSLYFIVKDETVYVLYLQDDRVATAWLNDPAIRKAIHAKEVSNSVLILLLYYIKKVLLMCLKILQESEIGRWVLCTGKLSFHHDAGSMISFHRNLTLSGYRALIYRYFKQNL